MFLFLSGEWQESEDAPVHGLSLDVSEPDPQIWSEVLSRQLQHGDVASAV